MGDVAVTIRRADDTTLPYVEALLERNDLPVRDVRSRPGCFFVASAGGDRVGIGGLERHGVDGLLRSIVVERSARGSGYGAAICEALEAEARAEGVETLYLLTTTASSFFAHRGYVEIERTDAPGTVRQTAQFDGLCPASATCMRRSLSR